MIQLPLRIVTFTTVAIALVATTLVVFSTPSATQSSTTTGAATVLPTRPIQVGLSPSIGYEVAGLPPGSVTTQLTSIVAGSKGVIKRIVVDNEYALTRTAVELWVDGKFAGAYRGPYATNNTVALDFPPVYDVNIKFANTVEVKVTNFESSPAHSVSVHYLPTP